MKQKSSWWISALIGFAAFVLAFVCYCWLRSQWFGYENGGGSGWGDWAYQQGEPKYSYYQQLFYNSAYVITGIITGGIAGAGPVDRSSRSLRFAVGPGLMCLYWLIAPVGTASSTRHLMIYFCVVTVAFWTSAFLYGWVFRSRPVTFGAERQPGQEGVWPPPPQTPS